MRKKDFISDTYTQPQTTVHNMHKPKGYLGETYTCFYIENMKNLSICCFFHSDNNKVSTKARPSLISTKRTDEKPNARLWPSSISYQSLRRGDRSEAISRQNPRDANESFRRCPNCGCVAFEVFTTFCAKWLQKLLFGCEWFEINSERMWIYGDLNGYLTRYSCRGML